MIDVARARADTPGCANVIHFNNAGAALPPAVVTAAVIDHLRLESSIGGYEAAAAAAEAVDGTYAALADLLGCRRSEIALCDSATRAWDLVFSSLPLQRGDRIITSAAEYGSNYVPFLQAQARLGVEIDVAPADRHGQVDVTVIRDLITDRTRLISLTHVPTNGGLVNPAAAVGTVAREAGVFYLLDACQSVGQMPLDVDELGCDALTATGRKFLRGPRGTGFLYMRERSVEGLEPPTLDIRSATWVGRDRYEVAAGARRFELWESDVAAVIGLGVAVDYAQRWGMEAIEERVTALADGLRNRLSDLPGVELHDLGQHRCAIVTFTTPTEPAELRRALAATGINVSVSTRDSTLLDMDDRGLTEVVRASVHYYNTEDEIDRFTETLQTRLP